MFYPTKKILHMLHRKITTSVILIVIISLSGNFATGKNDILFKIYFFKGIKNRLIYTVKSKSISKIDSMIYAF